MKKIAVILYGPPGAGKGTQANLIAKEFDLINFDTGRFLEAIWHDPKRQKEPLVKKERKIWETGGLNSSEVVTPEILRETKHIAAAGWGVVFSGSPRTIYEAEREYPVFEKLFGKKNIFIFLLDLPAADSIKRNGARMVCSVCGYLLLTAFYPHNKPKHCPVCAGPFYKRSLDNPKVIKVRLHEYKVRTLPIIDLAKKRGYRVVKLDARPAPYKVLQKINAHIKNAGRN